MDLNTLIKIETWEQHNFYDYVKDCGGIHKLKKKDLDLLISEKIWLIDMDSFMEIYRMVSDNESGRIIKIWTWIAGLTSVASLIVAIIS